MNHRLQHHRDCHPGRCPCALHTPPAKCGHCEWLETFDWFAKMSWLIVVLFAIVFMVLVLAHWRS